MLLVLSSTFSLDGPDVFFLAQVLEVIHMRITNRSQRKQGKEAEVTWKKERIEKEKSRFKASQGQRYSLPCHDIQCHDIQCKKQNVGRAAASIWDNIL